MTADWSPQQLEQIGAAGELQIAVTRRDGSQRRWTPVWVVRANGQIYVRSWYRRDTGWFGDALRTRRACIRVPGLEAEVTVEDVGAGAASLRDSIDAGYRAKYGSSGSSSMSSDAAAATTLKLSPAPDNGPDD